MGNLYENGYTHYARHLMGICPEHFINFRHTAVPPCYCRPEESPRAFFAAHMLRKSHMSQQSRASAPPGCQARCPRRATPRFYLEVYYIMADGSRELKHRYNARGRVSDGARVCKDGTTGIGTALRGTPCRTRFVTLFRSNRALIAAKKYFSPDTEFKQKASERFLRQFCVSQGACRRA